MTCFAIFMIFIHLILTLMKNICMRSMANAALNPRKQTLGHNYIEDVTVNVPVSFDGSWQKRYGFNSLLGVVLAISIDTGCVISY